MKKVSTALQDLPGAELARRIALAAADKQAENMVVLDVRGLASFADYFVIMSGRSTRHVQSLAEAVDEAITDKRLRAGVTEGLNDGRWVLLDFSDVVVHVFYREVREFYDLEGLWHDAPRLALDPAGQLLAAEESSAVAG